MCFEICCILHTHYIFGPVRNLSHDLVLMVHHLLLDKIVMFTTNSIFGTAPKVSNGKMQRIYIFGDESYPVFSQEVLIKIFEKLEKN